MVADPDLFKRNAQMTGTYCCDDCFHFVKIKEAEVYSTVGIKAGAYNSKELERRIEDFIDNYSFAADVNMFLQHFAGNDMNVPVKPNNCYFCNGVIEDGDYRLIDVPVDNTIYLTGGKIKSCPSCWGLIKEFSGEFTITKLMHNHRIYEKICNCGDTYYVTERELTDRQAALEDDHLCPTCVVKQMHTDELVLDIALKQPAGFVDREPWNASRYDTWRINRFVPVDCQYCKDDDIDIDLTFDSDIIRKKYMSAAGKFMCHSCSQDTIGPIVVLKWSDGARKYYWQIYSIGTNLYRIVVRSPSGQVYRDEMAEGWLSDLILDYETWFYPAPSKVVSIHGK
jgi:hypothetical protein